MSSYVSAEARLRAEAGALACAILGVPADALTVRSHLRAAAAATCSETSGPMTATAATAAARQLLAELPEQSSLLPLAGSSYPRARDLLAQAVAAGTNQAVAAGTTPEVDVSALLAQAQAAVATALAESDTAFARANRQVIADQVVAFGQNADFDSIEMCVGDQVTAIDLRRGAEAVYVQIDSDGQVLREHFGTQGVSCLDRDDQLVAALESAGVELSTTERVFHGGERDGEKVLRAAISRDAEHPARGGVLNIERPLTGKRTVWILRSAPNPPAPTIDRACLMSASAQGGLRVIPEDAGTKPRRTLRLMQELDQARAAGSQVLITGPGVHDIFLDESERALWLLQLLGSYCQKRALGLISYRMSEGITSWPTLIDGAAVPVGKFGPEEGPVLAFVRMITDAKAAATPMLVVLDFVDGMLAADEGALSQDQSLLAEHIQTRTADIPGWQALGIQLVLIDRGAGIHRRLRGHAGFRTIQVSAPDVAESTRYLERATTGPKPLVLEPGLTPADAGRRVPGLLLRHLHEVSADSSAQAPLTAAALSAMKGRAVGEQSNGLLELLAEPVSFEADVAGMYNVRLAVLNELLKGRLTLRLILCGPPGVGKTHVARAIAGMLRVPLFRLGQMLGGILGETENNLELVIGLLQAMAPLALFIDEAEGGALGLRPSNGQRSSEAYGAITARLLEFLGDPAEDNGITIIATTNFPDRLDVAARSRFMFLPVLYASGPELAEIMGILARREGVPLDSDQAELSDLLTEYLAGGEVLSGRSAFEVLSQAWVTSLEEGRPSVVLDDVRRALRSRIASDWSAESEYSLLTSLLEPSDLSGLPWHAARRLGKPHPIPAYLRTYLTEDDGLDTEAIRKQLGSTPWRRSDGRA